MTKKNFQFRIYRKIKWETMMISINIRKIEPDLVALTSQENISYLIKI
jgi:hypothetical protein